ncbi:hypothetical protein GOP47_0018474 [Adiantum capillus-veneris]|uniref:Uncharacterized protein n=1 Tax=Adiantum capillus-veneris TaxID=13818 RepID=A0A9D4UDM0_ADICA|nr:hypothetical protein GOP47_0018474 [Adiantum capillus-veneris]
MHCVEKGKKTTIPLDGDGSQMPHEDPVVVDLVTKGGMQVFSPSPTWVSLGLHVRPMFAHRACPGFHAMPILAGFICQVRGAKRLHFMASLYKRLNLKVDEGRDGKRLLVKPKEKIQTKGYDVKRPLVKPKEKVQMKGFEAKKALVNPKEKGLDVVQKPSIVYLKGHEVEKQSKVASEKGKGKLQLQEKPKKNAIIATTKEAKGSKRKLLEVEGAGSGSTSKRTKPYAELYVDGKLVRMCRADPACPSRNTRMDKRQHRVTSASLNPIPMSTQRDRLRVTERFEDVDRKYELSHKAIQARALIRVLKAWDSINKKKV